MKLVLSVIILMFPFLLNAQTACASAKDISLDSLKSISNFSKEVVYFKIRKDSSDKKVEFSGDYKELIIQPSECNDQKSFSLDSSGLIIPSEEMINSGICYCNSCIERYSKFSMSKDLFFKVIGGKELNIRSLITEKETELAWYEKRLKAGDKIRLRNILFIGGEAKFRTVSFKDLNRLYDVLVKNPNVDVEIQGHVNSPGKRNNKENQSLSDARAKAVVDFLIKKGIKSDRLTAVGYGNTQMIYPKAKTEYEMQFNRRVEVLVK